MRSSGQQPAAIRLLGVAFTLFSWLSACAFVIVVATVAGAVLADDPGRLGRFIRTPNVGSSSSPGDADRGVGVRYPNRTWRRWSWNRPSAVT
jgi:hypothetical protein